MMLVRVTYELYSHSLEPSKNLAVPSQLRTYLYNSLFINSKNVRLNRFQDQEANEQ